MKRFFALLVALCWVVLAQPAFSQNYPTRPITLVVPVPPGGQIDGTARIIADALSKDLGQPVVIMNRPGGSMIVGTVAVAKAKPDGYTLLYGNTNLAVNPAIRATLPYDTLKDLEPITMLFKAGNIVVTLPDAPFKTLPELVARAKASKTPLKYSSYGIGAPTHLTMEFLAKKHKIELIHLPYAGNAPALEALLGGHVDFMMVDTTTSAPLIKSGRLKPIAVASTTRLSGYPDVPTVVEQNEPEMAHLPFQGILAPAGTPKEIVDRIHASLRKLADNAEFKAKMEAGGFEVVALPGEHMRKAIEDGIKQWKSIMSATGVELQN